MDFENQPNIKKSVDNVMEDVAVMEDPQEAIKTISPEEIKHMADADADTKEAGLKTTREALSSDKKSEAQAEQAEQAEYWAMAKDALEQMKKRFEARHKGLGKIFAPSTLEEAAMTGAIKDLEDSISNGEQLPNLEGLARRGKFDIKIPKEYPVKTDSRRLHAASNFGNY